LSEVTAGYSNYLLRRSSNWNNSKRRNCS